MSERLGNVPESVMLELADRIRNLEQSGTGIIDLSLGQPDAPAPSHIGEAVRESLKKPITSYTPAAGSQQLRTLLSSMYSKECQAEIKPSNVIVTCGSKHALFVSLLSLLDQGDELLVHEPFFPPYAEIAGLAGAKLNTVSIDSVKGGFRFDIDKLLGSVTSQTKVILVNYPNNPAGWTLEESEVQKLVDYCVSKGIFLVSDEIYDKIVFDGRNHSHAWKYSDASDYVLGLGSFSKTYSMVPYRLGFIVATERVCSQLVKSQRATITMVSPYIQAAGIAALSGPQDFIKQRLQKYTERRDKCMRIFKDHGIPLAKPEGAFYFFIEMPEETDVNKFALNLLEKERVAILPGEIFGSRWKNYVRLSFATPDESLYLGIEKFCSRYAGSKPS